MKRVRSKEAATANFETRLLGLERDYARVQKELSLLTLTQFFLHAIEAQLKVRKILLKAAILLLDALIFLCKAMIRCKPDIKVPGKGI